MTYKTLMTIKGNNEKFGELLILYEVGLTYMIKV